MYVCHTQIISFRFTVFDLMQYFYYCTRNLNVNSITIQYFSFHWLTRRCNSDLSIYHPQCVKYILLTIFGGLQVKITQKFNCDTQ
jgi:hypothetical protein